MAASFHPAAIFSDHMVLQRNKHIPVWGTGADGSVITVHVRDDEVSVSVKDGLWRVTLPPQEPGEPCTLDITDGTGIVSFKDVLFGDVWLAGGQSNMEWPLIDAEGGETEVKAAHNANIRHYQVPKCPYTGRRLAEAEAGAVWRHCTGEDATSVSAVAYWFAKEINARTGVPVGIIGCSWGGTSAAAWMSCGQLERLISGKRHIEGFTGGELTDYDGNTVDGDSPYRPGGLYETMLSRAAPYGLKGFIYYQGESDAGHHADYFDWMCLLIDQWRYDYRDNTLPFYLVQLPAYADGNWPYIRRAQERVSLFVRHTGLAVTLDCGEPDDVHPPNKAPVGYRLALQALKKTYGVDMIADGPRYKRCERAGNKVRVFFDHAEGGLELRGGDRGAFEIAGEDGVFVRAAAVVMQRNTLWVSSASVPEPQAVRYAWGGWCEASLFGASGLPAVPFWGET